MPVKYSDAAAKGFTLLYDLYAKYNTNTAQGGEPSKYLFDGNFWFAGNALHTMLDYLINVGAADKPVLTMGLAVYKKYSSSVWWRDDYAWWGNAFLLALNHPSISGADGDLVTSIDSCWQKLKGSWHDGAYGDRDNAASGAPVYGGVFNIPYDDTSTDPGLKGRNSVTNEGYWLLSQGLTKLQPTNAQYSHARTDMQDWFDQWLSGTYEPGLRDKRGLVLERPMGNAADPTWCWTGDQGLLFRALTNANASDKTASAIADAAFKNLTVPDANNHRILHEYLGTRFSGFETDYATGKGIFLRNLVAPGVKSPNSPYAADIKNNAAAVWLNRLDQKTNQFSYNWAGKDEPEARQLLASGSKSQDLCNLVMQASGLDALNAAILIAGDEVIPGS